jgi:DNA anti-recombination protein RmuC
MTLIALALLSPTATEITAFVAAFFVGAAELYRVWTTWNSKKVETATQEKTHSIDITAKMEDITTQRMDRLYTMYQATIEQLSKENAELKAGMSELQAQMRSQYEALASEIQQLRLENSVLAATIEKHGLSVGDDLGGSILRSDS